MLSVRTEGCWYDRGVCSVSSGPSYSDAGWRRQSARLTRLAALALLGASLAGCSAIGLPAGELAANRAPAVSGSARLLASVRVSDSVDPSDWETVRRTVAAVPAGETTDDRDWTNPDTGSAGTISALDAAADKRGSLCRAFATTVNDIHGIRRYRGEACKRSDGRWQLFGMTSDDASLS